MCTYTFSRVSIHGDEKESKVKEENVEDNTMVLLVFLSLSLPPSLPVCACECVCVEGVEVHNTLEHIITTHKKGIYHQHWSFRDQRLNELKATNYRCVTTASTSERHWPQRHLVPFQTGHSCLSLLSFLSEKQTRVPKTTRQGSHVDSVFWAVGEPDFVTSVLSKNCRPRDTFDNVGDRHPNCSWCQGGATTERADGNPEEKVASQWCNRLQITPLFCLVFFIFLLLYLYFFFFCTDSD